MMNEIPLGDKLSIVLAFVSIVVALACVAMAFLLTQSYRTNVKELTAIRKSSEETISSSRRALDSYQKLTLRFDIGLSLLYDIASLTNLISSYQEEIFGVLRPKEEARKRAVEIRNFNSEIRILNTETQVRLTELAFLFGESTEKQAHLQSLVRTNGDNETLKFLDKVLDFCENDADRKEIVKARTVLAFRLDVPISFVGNSVI